MQNLQRGCWRNRFNAIFIDFSRWEQCLFQPRSILHVSRKSLSLLMELYKRLCSHIELLHIISVVQMVLVIYISFQLFIWWIQFIPSP